MVPQNRSFIFFCRFLCLLSLLSIVLTQSNYNCGPDATYTIVETIPEQVDLWTNVTTFKAWKELIDSATSTLELGFFYINLSEGLGFNPEDGGYTGVEILNAIIAAKERGVTVRYVQNEPSSGFPDTDSFYLAKAGIDVRSINWTQFFNGNGILHTKMIVVDQKHVYIGSANLDWCSLTNVKELGVVVKNCPVLAQDASQMFAQYWLASAPNVTTLPQWPAQVDTNINIQNPANLTLSNDTGDVYIAASPKQFCAPNRTNDIDSVLYVINSANETISVEVMDYSASTLYDNPNFYWPVISNALTAAAFNRGVKVHLLFSIWNHTSPMTFQFTSQLDLIDGIEVRYMIIPPLEGRKPIPYTRVNHAKFMVTDNHAYVGTNNWSADYFLNTGGMSYTFNNPAIVRDLQSRFTRDWNSPYAHKLDCHLFQDLLSQSQME